MTYCCGILVREGLVMFADTRTNAGVDNIATFRKLHVFKDPGKRIMAIASAGNLSISQSVVSILTEGYDNPETGEHETRARKKLRDKHLDAIAVNDVRGERGFGTGENELVLLWGEDGRRELGRSDKKTLAARLLDALEELMRCS